MEFRYKLFLAVVIGIFVIIFIANEFSPEYSGEVVSIDKLSGRIILHVDNVEEEVVIFDEGILDLSVGDLISFSGRKSRFLGRNQVIASRISLVR